MSLHHSFVPNMILKPIFSAPLLLTMSFSFLTGLLSCYAILCFNFSSLVPALFNCTFFPLFSPSLSLSLLRSFIFIKLLDFVQDESSCSVDSRGVKHVNRRVFFLKINVLFFSNLFSTLPANTYDQALALSSFRRCCIFLPTNPLPMCSPWLQY